MDVEPVTSSEILQIDRICRTCMCEILTKSKSVFDFYEDTFGILSSTTINDMLISCSLLNVSESINLPSHICETCLSTIGIVYKFKLQCNKTEDFFRQYFKLEIVHDATKIEHCLEEQDLCFESEQKVDIGESNMDYDGSSTTQSETVEEEEIITECATEESQINKSSRHVCQLCNKSYAYRHGLKEHLATHNSNARHRCKSCNKSYIYAQGLREHMRLHDNRLNNKTNQCTVCGKCFSRTSVLNLHMKCHSDERPYPCDLCNKKYRRHHHLQVHKESAHLGNKCICTVCGKELSSSVSLYTHMLIHKGEKNHVCNVCAKKFSKNSQLVVHMRQHSDVKPFLCLFEDCHQGFHANVLLVEHVRQTHTGEKPYKCETCDKAFSRAGSYKSHLKMHTRGPALKCTDCDKCFVSNRTLNEHRRLHTGLKPFTCKMCNDAFTTSNKLSLHVKTKHMERQFECGVCNKRFFTKKVLQDHIRIHTGDKPFSCHECGAAFTQSSGLYQHIKSHKKSNVISSVTEYLVMPC